MKIVIIDNYDSFTFNLYQYIAEFESETMVFRNDRVSIAELKAINPDKIIISPGPGRPDDPAYFGICAAVIKEFARNIPILGVCLGHQGIANLYGAHIIIADKVMHGKTSQVIHNADSIFKNVPKLFEVMRYHSLIIQLESLPNSFNIIAKTKEGIIMGIKHKSLPLYGLQFHPESVGTPDGKQILQNFLYLN